MNFFYFKKQNPTDMDSSFGCAYFIVRNFDIKRVDKSPFLPYKVITKKTLRVLVLRRTQ